MGEVIYISAIDFYAGALDDLADRHGVTLTAAGRRGSDVRVEVNGRDVSGFVNAVLHTR